MLLSTKYVCHVRPLSSIKTIKTKSSEKSKIMKTHNSFLDGQSPFSSYILSSSTPSSSGITPTCVETPPTELPTTILPTIVPTEQPTIQENESVGPCAGVLQYEPVSGKPRNVAHDRSQWQCANSHLTSSQYLGGGGSSIGKQWRANVRSDLFVTITILLQHGNLAPQITLKYCQNFGAYQPGNVFYGAI